MASLRCSGCTGFPLFRLSKLSASTERHLLTLSNFQVNCNFLCAELNSQTMLSAFLVIFCAVQNDAPYVIKMRRVEAFIVQIRRAEYSVNTAPLEILHGERVLSS